MDNISQHLDTECFSYRWLATDHHQPAPKPNSSSIHNHEDDHSSNFDFEITSEFPLVDADKLFSNGVIKPQYLTNTTPSKIDNYDPLANTATISSSLSSCIPSSSLDVIPKVSHYSKNNNAGEFELQGILPRKWRKIVSKYLIRCFIPVNNKSTTRGGKTRVDDVNRRTSEVRRSSSSSSVESNGASARVRRQSCAWSDDASDESSIHEAILYCKQSNGF